MTRIIAASPLLQIRRNDTVTVTAGDYAGETGLVVSVFRGRLTVGRLDGQHFTVPIDDCEKEEAAGVVSGLYTTQTA